MHCYCLRTIIRLIIAVQPNMAMLMVCHVLPLPALAEIDDDYAECFYFEPFQTLPVTAVQISRETRKDKILSRVFAAVLSGNWTVSKDQKLVFEKRNELSICQDCLEWGPKGSYT